MCHFWTKMCHFQTKLCHFWTKMCCFWTFRKLCHFRISRLKMWHFWTKDVAFWDTTTLSTGKKLVLFKFTGAETLSRPDALDLCANVGGYIVLPESQTEQNEIYQFIKEFRHVGNELVVWVRIIRDPNDSSAWIDDKTGEPSPWGGEAYNNCCGAGTTDPYAMIESKFNNECLKVNILLI